LDDDDNDNDGDEHVEHKRQPVTDHWESQRTYHITHHRGCNTQPLQTYGYIPSCTNSACVRS